MKISQLAVSPAAMFVEGFPAELVKKQSALYRLDKRTISQLCHSLEAFLPELIIQFKENNRSSVTTTQWLVLSKSIIHSLVSWLLILETVQRHAKKIKLVDDVKIYRNFFPQTQEQLMTKLSSDQKLHEALFSIALLTIEVQVAPPTFSTSLTDVYSWENLKYWLAKKRAKLFQKRHQRLAKNLKKRIIILAADNVHNHFEHTLAKSAQFVKLDDFVQTLYRFPRGPDQKLRVLIAKKLVIFLVAARIGRYFSSHKDHHFVKNTAGVISRLLPVTLVEDFDNYQCQIVAKLAEIKPNLVITSAGHHQEFANLCLALTDRLQVPLLTFQHGASYAEFKSMQSERTIETALYRTTYYSWGKNFKACQGKQGITKVKAIGSPYLQALPKLNYQVNQIKRVLIPLDPIYYYQVLESYIPTPPGYIYEQYDTVINFIKYLIKEYPELKIVIKTKTGHANQLSIKQYFSGQELASIEFHHIGKTYDYFNRETLVFLPILSGAFNEVMTAEIPLIVYVPKSQAFFKKEVNVILEKLVAHSAAATSIADLKRAFRNHYQNQVDYPGLKKISKQYRSLACLINPKWQHAVDLS